MTATKDDIITLPNEHLRQRSQKIGLVTEEIRQLVNDMVGATLDWEDSREQRLTENELQRPGTQTFV